MTVRLDELHPDIRAGMAANVTFAFGDVDGEGAADLGGHIVRVPAPLRPAYHAATVMASSMAGSGYPRWA